MSEPVRSRPTPWIEVLLLCGKCARKMKGGFGEDGKDTLRTALRAELKARALGRQTRVIETHCLGLCPKKAVTALNASRPDRLLIIAKRTDAAEALAQLSEMADPGRCSHPDRVGWYSSGRV